MQRAHCRALCVGLLISLLTASSACAGWLERKWTNTEGKTITATFIRATPTMALLNQNGKVIRAPLNQLVQADRDWIAAAEELKKLREWQLADGRAHRARLHDIQGETILLEERSDTIELTIAELNAEDQALVARVAPPTAAGGVASRAPMEAGSVTSRKWTDKSGKTIDAEYRGVEGDKVVLYFREKEWRVSLDDLSTEDQQFIDRQQRENGIVGNNPAAPPSLEGMSQEERIEELLRRRREQAGHLAQAPSSTPPSHEPPAHAGPTPSPPHFPEPRFSQPPHHEFRPPSFAQDHRPRHSRGWKEAAEDEAESHAPQFVYQQVIICQGCRYEHPAATFKAGDKCRGCGHRIDVIQNADGSTHSSSASYSGRKIGKIITGVAALIGLLCGAVKKVLG